MKLQISNYRFQINNIIYISIISGLNLIFVVSSIAAEAEGHGEHAFTWRDWLWPVVNFAILVIVLFFFGRKPISDYFKKRTEGIEKSLQEAKEAKELARKALEEVRSRLKNTDQDIEQILKAAKTSGEKEKEEIIAEGQRLKEKIIEQARANIELELQKAKETIKSEAALVALEQAEKQIREKLGKKEQEELINDYIKRLEEKN